MMDALIPATMVLTNEGNLKEAVAAAEKVRRSLNQSIAIRRINE